MTDDLATQIAQQIAIKTERHDNQEEYARYVDTVATIIRDRILMLTREPPTQKKLIRAAKRALKLLDEYCQTGAIKYSSDVAGAASSLDRAVRATLAATSQGATQ